MRRLMSIAAFAVLFALPVWAQRGGGHAGFGGGHATFGGHPAVSGGRMGTGHFSGGTRAGIGYHGISRPTRAGYSRAPFLHDRVRSDRFRSRSSNRFRERRFRNNCFGHRCRGYGYPWWYSGYWEPWWWDSGSSYDEDYERDRALAAEMNEQSLEQQRLLRQEEAEGDGDADASSSPAPHPTGSDPQGTAIVPDTVLVFRDQHKKEVQNYAIIGQTLWSFSPQKTEKIPIAQLDLPATIKANDDQGVTFRVPGASQAQ